MTDAPTVGAKFGKLTILAADRPDRNYNKMWLVRCDCGASLSVQDCALRRGQKSCRPCATANVIFRKVSDRRRGLRTPATNVSVWDDADEYGDLRDLGVGQ